MDPITNQQDITADGEYSLEAFSPGREAVFEWSIADGCTADVTPGYVDMHGRFAPLRDGYGVQAAGGSNGGSLRADIPSSGMLALKVENSAGSEPVGGDPISFTMQACITLIDRGV